MEKEKLAQTLLNESFARATAEITNLAEALGWRYRDELCAALFNAAHNEVA